MDEIITLAQHIYAAAHKKHLRLGVDKDVDIISAYKPIAEMHPHDIVACWMALQLLQQEQV